MSAAGGETPSSSEAFGTTIASYVAACIQSFEDFSTVARHSASDSLDVSAFSEVTDELGRFRIWAGNIGAHRRGQSSLDYRLRDASHIREKVQALLVDLNGVLQRALEILRGDRIPWDNRVQEPDSDSDLTDSESESGSPQGEIELRQLVISLHDNITYLLRLSISIRNPAPHDQYMNSAKINKSHFESFDTNHVRDKFPNAPEHMVVALGKANSRRREYFDYRKSHSKRLSDGLETEIGAHEGAFQETADGKTEVVPQSTLASSIPEELKSDNNFLNLDQEQHSESGFTQTSFATSTAGSQGPRVPPLPTQAHGGEPFQCPFCFMIISVGSRKSWKKHVYKDLHPYACTFPCLSSKRLFERRHEWFQHELQFHRRFWQCVEPCESRFESQSNFEAHIKDRHPSLGAPGTLAHLLAMCEKQASMGATGDCKLCGRRDLCLKYLGKHVGRHQEQLALFVLPSIPGENEEEQDVSDADTAEVEHDDESTLSSHGDESTDENMGRLPSPHDPNPDIEDDPLPLPNEKQISQGLHKDPPAALGSPDPTPAEKVVIATEAEQAERFTKLEGLLMAQAQAKAVKEAAKKRALEEAVFGKAEAKKKGAEDMLAKSHDLIIAQREDINARDGAIEENTVEKQKAAEGAAKLLTAAKKAREEAEKKAVGEVQAAEEAHQKALAEAAAAAEELKKAKEAAEAKAEEEVEQRPVANPEDAPPPEEKKPPIRFKDAVGRSFIFPWHLCCTWSSMETLIKHAFLSDDIIGRNVHEGHYNLIGPEGEIILPQVWETMVQPDMLITMHMWPMENQALGSPPPPYPNSSIIDGGSGPPGPDDQNVIYSKPPRPKPQPRVGFLRWTAGGAQRP